MFCELFEVRSGRTELATMAKFQQCQHCENCRGVLFFFISEPEEIPPDLSIPGKATRTTILVGVVYSKQLYHLPSGITKKQPVTAGPHDDIGALEENATFLENNPLGGGLGTAYSTSRISNVSAFVAPE
ncbi:hypothetical protein pipiens_007950 [Culex pipiens pipiens]|uniref:Uncharacterized protein n=1 Tax=Culex pipiens pipiens TaxID=38569 RepID=A0ABD1DJS1_CULPP